MRKAQNANISLRVTKELKRRLTEFCEERELPNSLVVRQALNAYLLAQTRRDHTLSKAVFDSIR